VIVAAVGFGAVVRPAAPFVFVGLLTLYLFVRRARDRSPGLVTGLAAVLPAAAILVWRSLPQPIADATVLGIFAELDLGADEGEGDSNEPEARPQTRYLGGGFQYEQRHEAG